MRYDLHLPTFPPRSFLCTSVKSLKLNMCNPLQICASPWSMTSSWSSLTSSQHSNTCCMFGMNMCPLHQKYQGTSFPPLCLSIGYYCLAQQAILPPPPAPNEQTIFQIIPVSLLRRSAFSWLLSDIAGMLDCFFWSLSPPPDSTLRAGSVSQLSL